MKPPPPSGAPKTAQQALEDARRAEAERKQAAAEAKEKRALAQKLADEARARMEEQRAREAAIDQRRRAEEARREAARAREEDREAEDQAARDRAMFRTPAPAHRTGPITAPIVEGKVLAILRRLADDIELVDVFTEIRPDVLGMLWQAHVKRARMERDLPTMALALTLARRFEERPEQILAAKVAWAGTEWAVWLDVERKEVIAALTPADRYLTGL